MDIKTALNCGDKVWYFYDVKPVQITVGQVRVEFTHSAGCSDYDFIGSVTVNDGENYAFAEPQQAERYMCVETGIGSGLIHTLGETIFTSECQCLAANEERMAARRLANAQQEKIREDRELGAEGYLRQRLLEIEAIKASRK